jgi:adenylate kinase family enzyme
MGCIGSKASVSGDIPDSPEKVIALAPVAEPDDSEIDPDTNLTYGEERAKFGEKIIIFLIGGPGSGKGTQSERIIQDFDTGYMSAGDLLRKEAASDTELGRFIGEQMKNGAIVPQEITIRLLKKEILSQEKQLYLIDGFPRAVEQAETFEKTVCPCKCALFLVVPDDVLIDRLIKRSETSGRADDNPETITKRIKVFHDVCEQVSRHFEKTNRTVRIDGNRDPDEVYADIKAFIEKIVQEDPFVIVSGGI